jgi:hypothetical protein
VCSSDLTRTIRTVGRDYVLRMEGHLTCHVTTGGECRVEFRASGVEPGGTPASEQATATDVPPTQDCTPTGPLTFSPAHGAWAQFNTANPGTPPVTGPSYRAEQHYQGGRSDYTTRFEFTLSR